MERPVNRGCDGGVPVYDGSRAGQRGGVDRRDEGRLDDERIHHVDGERHKAKQYGQDHREKHEDLASAELLASHHGAQILHGSP